MYYSIIFAISFFLFLKEYARKGEEERAGIYKLTRERKRQRSIAWPYLKSARAQSVLSSSIPGKKNAIFKTNRGNESRNFRDGEGKKKIFPKSSLLISNFNMYLARIF